MAYKIVAGCGSTGVLQPDGTWIVTQTHGDGCPPEHHQRDAEPRVQAPVGVFGDLSRLAFGDGWESEDE